MASKKQSRHRGKTDARRNQREAGAARAGSAGRATPEAIEATETVHAVAAATEATETAAGPSLVDPGAHVTTPAATEATEATETAPATTPAAIEAPQAAPEPPPAATETTGSALAAPAETSRPVPPRRATARPASWARAGWIEDGGKGLGIAGAARKPGAPGTHVTSSSPLATYREPLPRTRQAPIAQDHGDRPVVRVSLAEAAAAGRQALRPLTPVSRSEPATDPSPASAPGEGRKVRHVGTASSGNVAPVPGLRTSGQEPGSIPGGERPVRHVGTASSGSATPIPGLRTSVPEPAASGSEGERPVRHVGTASSGSATPIPGLRTSVPEPATPGGEGARPVRHLGTASTLPGTPESFPTAGGPRTAPWARPVAVVDATGPRDLERATARRKEVAPAVPLHVPDPDARYFAVKGLSSPACVHRVEKAVRAVEGVKEAEANLAAGVVAVSPSTIDPLAVAEALAGAGHPPLEDPPGAAVARKGALQSALSASAVLVIGIAAAILDGASGPLVGTVVASLALAAGWPAVGPGLWHLLRGRMSAEILPLIGTVGILTFSFLEPTRFSSGLAVAPLFVHLVGMALVQLARARALGILSRLREALPASRGISIGQSVTVGAGDVIPVDGRLLETALLDERIFGGEDEVERLQGESVAAGTLVLHGARLTATATAEGSRLVRGLAIAERALSTHPSGTPASWASRLVVPVALAAAVAGAIWGGTWIGAAVLAATGSLGLALAGSLSTAAAVTRAASRGVAVRSSEALDRAGRTEQVLFDKSSTLTRGDTAVLEFLVKPGRDPQTLLGQITAAHTDIDHPISRALLNHAADLLVEIPVAREVDYQPGLGVRAKVEGREVLVGSIHHTTRSGVEIGLLSQTVDELARRGRTPLVAAIDGEAVAVLGLADTPRESARQTVGSLENLDVALRIASGDATASVQWLAEGIGLDRRVARGDLGPEAKRELVEELRSEGPCLMAGANVVDVPALTAADLAVSVGVHPEVEAAAGALLIRQDPHGVVELVRAGRALRRGRRLATVLGVAGNVAAMSLAALGWIGVGGAASLALCTNLVSIGAAASPWIRIR